MRVDGCDHLQALFCNTERFEDPVKEKDSLLRFLVAVLEMAVAVRASEEQNPVGPFMKGANNVGCIHFAYTDNRHKTLQVGDRGI